MANDRREEAWEVILKAAQMNGKPLSKDIEMSQVKMFIISNSIDTQVCSFFSKWKQY